MASTQIAAQADLSQRTEEAKPPARCGLHYIMEEPSTVRNNAENSRQASQLAQLRAAQSAGRQVVGQVVDTMRGISDSSRASATSLA